MEKCYKCGVSGAGIRLYSSFGKLICKQCLMERKTGRKGHSEMIYDKNIREEDYFDKEIEGKYIYLKQVPKSNKLFVKWFMDHYPKSKGIVGRQLSFLIYSYGKPIGIMGFASPPLNYLKFNEFFGLNESKKASENAKLFMNNNVFRIVHSEKNLGTQILKLARQKVQVAHVERYGEKLIGLVTFVEPPRTGSIYKADNWQYIGMTQGVEVKRRGDKWMEKQYMAGEAKYIYGYKFRQKG